MANSKVGAENIQNELENPVVQESNKVTLK